MPTTAAAAVKATGTAIKTLIQLKGAAGKIKAYGISFDGAAAAVPLNLELCVVNVAGTVTAYGSADIYPVNQAAVNRTSALTLSTTTSGFTCTSEGSITTVRYLDPPQLVPPTAPFYVQFPLGDEPEFVAADYVRMRITAPVTVNCYPWIKWEE